MRFSQLAKAVLAISLVLVAAVPSWANKIPVRGGSTYGDNPGFDDCLAHIQDSTNFDNCEASKSASFTVGGTPVTLFAFLEPGRTASGILDIIQIATGASLSLNLVDPNLPTGLFVCGSFGVDRNVAVDSTPNEMTGLPCTPGLSSNPLYFEAERDFADIQANFSATGVTFINGTNGPISVF